MKISKHGGYDIFSPMNYTVVHCNCLFIVDPQKSKVIHSKMQTHTPQRATQNAHIAEVGVDDEHDDEIESR